MNKIYISDNYIIIEEVGKQPVYFSGRSVYGESTDSFYIFEGAKHMREIHLGFVSVPTFFDEAGTTPFTEETLRTFLRQNTGKISGGGNGSGVTISQSVDGYSNFVDGTEIGQIAYSKISEGTRWLPFSLGGTYYPAGFYTWDGVKWVSDRNAIANQIEQNILSIELINTRLIDGRVVIKQASDFGGVWDPTLQYFIDGLIDMGTTELTIIGSGFIAGTDYFLSGLYSTADNYTMFKTAPGQPISNFRAKELNFWASGTNSKLFDLEGDGSGSIEFNGCNKGDFTGTTTSLGQLTTFRQYRTNDAGFFLVKDGLTFNGNWSGGFRIGDTIALATIGTVTLFKEGTDLVFGGRSLSNGNFASLSTTTTVFDFQESNFSMDGGFQLEGASFNKDANPIPNISESSVKAFFRDSIGIQDTDVRTLLVSDTQVVNTLALNVEEKVEGTTAIKYATWMSSPVPNRITIDTALDINLEVTYKCRIDGGPNDEIALSLYHWDDSASTFTQIAREIKTVSNVQGGFDVVDFDIEGLILGASIGDYIEPRIENVSDSTDATVLIGAKLKAVLI